MKKGKMILIPIINSIVAISFIVAQDGSPNENIDIEKLNEYMQWDSIHIEINLNLGSENFQCYTCDFTNDYIDINADYKNST